MSATDEPQPPSPRASPPRFRLSPRSSRWLALAFAMPGAAWAELQLVPYGSAQYEHHSNLFEVSGPAEAVAQRGESQRAESVWKGLVGVEAGYTAGQQQLQLSAEGRRLEYQHFNDLDHDEYTYAGKFSWKLGSTVDGAIDYRQDRRVASFADLDSSELSLQSERRARAMVGYAVTPSWRVEAAGAMNQSKLPLVDDPDFELKDSSGSLEIKYLGVAGWSTGLLAEVGDGRYSGNLEHERDFNETTLQLTTDYVVDGMSRLGVKLGATQRDEDAADGSGGKMSGFTGSIGYQRTLSAKTAVDVGVFRRVDSFVAGANALIATGGSAALNWKPTPNLVVSARYEYTRSAFDDDGGADEAGRRDHFNIATLDLSYQMLRWLTLRPFASYRNRDSSFADESFEDVMLGAELRLRFD